MLARLGFALMERYMLQGPRFTQLLLPVLLYFSCNHPALADWASALTEVYAAEGIPGQEVAAPSGVHGILGPGIADFDKRVGDSRQTLPFPLVLMTYSDWVHWSVAGGGIWLLRGVRPIKLGVGIKLHPGWKPGDDPLLTGMQARDGTVDGAVNILWRTRLVNVSANYYHDLRHVSSASSATLRLSRSFLYATHFLLTPNLGVEWESAALVDHQYGVRPAEALPSRPAYSGSSTDNYSLGLTGTYLDHRWCVLGGVQATYLGDHISNSPIVPNRVSRLAFLAVGVRF